MIFAMARAGKISCSRFARWASQLVSGKSCSFYQLIVTVWSFSSSVRWTKIARQTTRRAEPSARCTHFIFFCGWPTIWLEKRHFKNYPLHNYTFGLCSLNYKEI